VVDSTSKLAFYGPLDSKISCNKTYVTVIVLQTVKTFISEDWSDQMTEKLTHLTSITVEALFIPFKALRDETERRLFRY